jgi:hypothetical protein
VTLPFGGAKRASGDRRQGNHSPGRENLAARRAANGSNGIPNESAGADQTC